MRWFPEGASPLSVAALVVANLVPVLGVLLGGWSLLLLLVLYWLESGVVGAVNVAKIAMARGSEPPSRRSGGRRPAFAGARTPPLVAIPFFVLHYGVFWVLHGVLILLLPVFVGMGSTMFAVSDTGTSPLLADLGTIEPFGVAVATLGLVASHVVSFFVNYLGRGEHLTVSPGAQMFRVYGRVVVPQATALLAAPVIGLLGAPAGVLVVFVLVRTAVDLAFHVGEHRRAQASGAQARPAAQVPGRTAPDS